MVRGFLNYFRKKDSGLNSKYQKLVDLVNKNQDKMHKLKKIVDDLMKNEVLLNKMKARMAQHEQEYTYDKDDKKIEDIIDTIEKYTRDLLSKFKPVINNLDPEKAPPGTKDLVNDAKNLVNELPEYYTTNNPVLNIYTSLFIISAAVIIAGAITMNPVLIALGGAAAITAATVGSKLLAVPVPENIYIGKIDSSRKAIQTLSDSLQSVNQAAKKNQLLYPGP